MASRDGHNCCKIVPAIDPAAIKTGNATTTGAIIDTQGFEAVEIAFQSGIITDGTFTCSLEEGDQANLSDAGAVAAGDLIGAAPVFAAADDSVVKKVGYRGTKRYVRPKAVQAGATTGGFLSAVAMLTHARSQPVA